MPAIRPQRCNKETDHDFLSKTRDVRDIKQRDRES